MKIKVTSSGEVRVVESEAQILSQALLGAGYPLNVRCHGRGLCRGCLVVVDGQEVMACKHPLKDGQNVEIPTRSLVSHAPSIISEYKTEVSIGDDPIFIDASYGVAVDIGTTTVAAQLVHLSTGRVVARGAGMNAQVTRGDNVLTRIHLCQSDKSQIALLRDDFWLRTFVPLYERLLKEGNVKYEEVAGVVIAANTTMLHLARNIDPTSLGLSPFTPQFLSMIDESCEYVRHVANISRTIYLPGVSAYVGADIVAGVVCCGMTYSDKPQMIIDIGTNGEMLLATPRGNWVCATAAGPAFEGNGLVCGTRAATGVVGRIVLDATTLAAKLDVIGNPPTPPFGIAGSAYVDFLAEGHRCGLLNSSGRFTREAREAHPERFDHGGQFFRLSDDNPSLGITEGDIAALLQAKAAIAAGVDTLLSLAGLTAADIDRVFLAGGFGLHISIDNAIACGLLPRFRTDQIQAVGNTSLGGATLALLDASLAEEMNTLSASIVELNTVPTFEDCYLDHLSL